MSDEKYWVVKEGTLEETMVSRAPATLNWIPPLFASNVPGRYRFTLTYKVEKLEEKPEE